MKGFSPDPPLNGRMQLLLYNANKQTSPLWLYFIFKISLTLRLFKIGNRGVSGKITERA